MRLAARTTIGAAFVWLGSLGCSAMSGTVAGEDGILRASGNIRFEIYQDSVCGRAGPSPVGRCSRSSYTGGLHGDGDTAIQRLEPLTPDGMYFVSENEVLRLPDGELRSAVNAVFHDTSHDREVASLHTVTGGTGRYAGASGHIRLWRADGEVFAYVATIRLGTEHTAR
jgi:hypothetical protein